MTRINRTPPTASYAAQQPATAEGKKKSRKKGEPKVIRLEAIKVEGRIQKPEAFYILQRASLNHSVLRKRPDFLSKITEGVEELDEFDTNK